MFAKPDVIEEIKLTSKIIFIPLLNSINENLKWLWNELMGWDEGAYNCDETVFDRLKEGYMEEGQTLVATTLKNFQVIGRGVLYQNLI